MWWLRSLANTGSTWPRTGSSRPSNTEVPSLASRRRAASLSTPSLTAPVTMVSQATGRSSMANGRRLCASTRQASTMWSCAMMITSGSSLSWIQNVSTAPGLSHNGSSWSSTSIWRRGMSNSPTSTSLFQKTCSELQEGTFQRASKTRRFPHHPCTSLEETSKTRSSTLEASSPTKWTSTSRVTAT